MFKRIRDAAISSESLATDQGDLGGQWIQMEMLKQLKKVSKRLVMVEDQVVATSHQAVQALHRRQLSDPQQES